MIKKNKIEHIDKEMISGMEISGFCWNSERKFVVFNER
jgi:hypothetical protein